MKTIGGLRRPVRGTDHVGWDFTFTAATYNLICVPSLLNEAA
jgi:hypothetical protein